MKVSLLSHVKTSEECILFSSIVCYIGSDTYAHRPDDHLVKELIAHFKAQTI